jgi:hypothetical protein
MILWGISFFIGVLVGLRVPIIGDLIAMCVSIAFIVLYQAYVLRYLNFHYHWVRWSFVSIIPAGLISLLVVFLAHRLYFNLIDAHFFTLPVAAVIIVTAQGVLMQRYSLINWHHYVFINMFGILLGMMTVYLINLFYSLSFDILGTREFAYEVLLNWFIIGIILGLFFGIFNGLSFKFVFDKRSLSNLKI